MCVREGRRYPKGVESNKSLVSPYSRLMRNGVGVKVGVWAGQRCGPVSLSLKLVLNSTNRKNRGWRANTGVSSNIGVSFSKAFALISSFIAGRTPVGNNSGDECPSLSVSVHGGTG